MLAEGWTIHARPDGVSVAGPNQGGVAAIEFKLREDVTFHDGSAFNASVVKWNFDRLIEISENLQWHAIHWFDPTGYVNRFIPTWNLSWAITDIPYINETIVVSEFVVKIIFNKWYTSLDYFAEYHGIISQAAYGPWFNTSISGYESVPNAPNGTPFPGHMIGTGPYKFESVDFVVESEAHAIKYDNYWNKTALEALGVFSVTDLYVRFFANDTSLGNALLATDIDLTRHTLQAPSPVDDVKTSPYLDYIPTVPDASVNVVSLLSAEAINTPLASLGGQTIREWFPTSTFCTDTLGLPSGTQYPNGLNKTVRKALSWAYDYNGLVSAVYPSTGGGGIYCWSPFGMSSPFTDEGSISHPGPDPNVTAARTILLNDPYYAGLAAARGLSLANTTAEWNYVANTEPIDTYTFLTYPGAEKTGFLTEACEALGFELDVREDAAVAGELWTQFVATGRACMYDMFSYIYLMNPLDPAQYGRYWYSSGAAKPPGWAYNYAHIMNATVDNIMENVEFLTDKQSSYNELADILINKEVPAIYESQGSMGICINAGFTYTSYATEFSGTKSPGISIAHIGGERVSDSNDGVSTLTFGVRNGPSDIDPQVTWDEYSFAVIDQVVEGLFAYNLSDPKMGVIPNLALDYGTWSGNNYTVDLKPNIYFHDGTLFDAYAVKFTFDRLAYFMENSMAAAADLYKYYDIQASKIKNIINHTEVINANTIRFVLNQKVGIFETLLCFEGSYIVSPASTPATELIDLLTGTLVGTGPFVFENYIADSEVNFYAYENYWKGVSNVTNLKFSIITDELARNNALLSGDVDIITDPIDSMLDTYIANPNITLESIQGFTIGFIDMNDYWINTTFRNAISHAINYSYIITELLEGSGVRMKSPFPENMVYANWSYNVADFDVASARETMQSMGFGIGWDTTFGGPDEANWAAASFATFNYTYNIGNSFKE
ncbi:MAG: ABC transporter substrate-binding protein, partial [Candidatus Heimdallarchaeota archaeon]